MDCREFDGQVVRLERLKDVADQFVRVRLPRIDNADLALFEFDYDLTFMAFFLDAGGKVYARYGGRDAAGPDTRQSLEGLRYTMESVLEAHRAPEKEYAPRTRETPKFIREVQGARPGGRCMHCHQVREALNSELKRNGDWARDLIYRYPLPENVGVKLDVHRGNVVRAVTPKSPAEAAGLRPGDVLVRLAGVPVHSFADVQYALDNAPAVGVLEVVWRRGQDVRSDLLALQEGWRRSDLSWRPSLRHVIPAARVYGNDLTAAERQALGLAPKQLAFKQKASVSTQASSAGVKAGDVILGFDGQGPEMGVDEFLRHVQRSYLVGDRVTVNVVRDGKRLDLAMTPGRGTYSLLSPLSPGGSPW